MAEANPKLLALLDKMLHPIEKVKFDLQVTGVYAFPEEWKTTDDANPNLFTYQVKMPGVEVLEGKIYPRQLTEKEIKEQEEAAAAKNKKAAKKDAKNQPVEPQLTAEEEEAIRKKKEQEEEEERKRQEEWNALDEQTKFYRTQEDKFKMPSLKFEKSLASIVKEGQDLVAFEERVYEDKGDWVYFNKLPTLTEDEIAKMKKAKPKNLNLSDLNPIITRAWVNYEAFQNPGCKEVTLRCKVDQVIDEKTPADTPKPNLENTYILLTITLDPPITPLIEEIQPKIQDIIPKMPLPPKLSAAKECIIEFKNESTLAMESLAIEYSQMFAKDMNSAQEAKSKNIVTVQKKQEIQKRKEQFLYDFNISGKYKVLKERLKKSIVKICRDKFQKHGSITGITTDQKDQFYSDLYVFLMEQTRQTLFDLIMQKKEELHEDIVTSYEQTQRERDKILQNITKETQQEKLTRLSIEYEILNQMELAEKNLRNLVNACPTDPVCYFTYTKFLLRQKNFGKAEEMLEKAIGLDNENKEYLQLLASLLMRRGRNKEAVVIIRQLIEGDQTNRLFNTMLSVVYSKFLQEQKLGEKFKRISERITLRTHGMIHGKGSHKQQPNPFELPSFKPLSLSEIEANKGPQLSNDQWDEIYFELVDYLAGYNLYDVIEKIIDLIFDPTTNRMQMIQTQIFFFKEKYTESLEILDKLLQQNSKNFDVINMKANICFISDKLYESEDTFLKILKLKGAKLNSVFLRLGTIYLKRKSWGDAKVIFIKACELKSNSSLSWLGLGISCLRLGQMKEAEEALTQANIYDPFNGETWGYLALLCLLDNQRFTQANQALRELFKTDIYEYQLLEELGDELSKIGRYETAEKLYLKIFEVSGNNKVQLPNYGELNLKLGKVYTSLKKYQDAIVCFEEAFGNLEGENDKELAKNLANQARYYSQQE